MTIDKETLGVPRVRYRFGEFELDVQSFTLRRAGHALHVTPKVFDLLRHLIEHRGRVVTKEELLDTLWADSQVNEVAVPWAVSHARRALGQRGKAKHPIETVHGRGYRFVSDVAVLERAQGEESWACPEQAPRELLPAHGFEPFVGREQAMARLRGRLAAALHGSGGVCALAGVAGIGKTRCMEELAAVGRAQGFAVWSGRSTEDTVAPAFWPWMQVVERLARERPELRSAAEGLLGRLDVAERQDESMQLRDAAPVGNFWFFDGVNGLLRQAADRAPILLLLDDLHWADAGSVQLLSFIAPELSQQAVLIVTAQREGLGARRARELRGLSRHVERIELEPLTPREVGEYLGAVTHASEPQRQLSEAIHRVTAGNPLFLLQTVRALIAQHGQGALASLPADVVEPVTSARDILRGALDALDPGAHRVLEVASVLGEDFHASTLQGLCELDCAALLWALEAAVQDGFVVAEEPHRYRFWHTLLRSTLYDDLAAADRAQIHRRAAHLLERSASGSLHLGQVAHHYHRSLPLGDYPRVVASAQQAARAAVRVQAFSEAATFCRWALEALMLDEGVQPRAHAELLLMCAQVEALSGCPGRAHRTIATLDEIARRHGDADLLVKAARVLRPTHLLGGHSDPKVHAMLEAALSSAAEDDHRVRIAALSQLSWLPPNALDMRRSKELSGRALSLARELGDDTALAAALQARLYALSGPDDIDELLGVADQMLRGDHVPPTWTSMEALCASYGALIYRGDVAAFDPTLAAQGRMAREQGLSEASFTHDRIAAQRHLHEGSFAACEAELGELRTRGQRLGLDYAGPLIAVIQAVLVAKRDGPAGLSRSWDSSVFWSSIHDVMGSLRPGLVRLCLASGQPGPAKSVLETMVTEQGAELPQDIGYLNALAQLAQLAVDFADRPRAERLYEQLAPYPHHNTPNCLMLYEGTVSHFLAILAAFVGRTDRVIAHFDDALSMNDKLGVRPQLAQTCYEYARFLLRTTRGPARAGAQALRGRAIELARGAGMGWLAANARALDAGDRS